MIQDEVFILIGGKAAFGGLPAVYVWLSDCPIYVGKVKVNSSRPFLNRIGNSSNPKLTDGQVGKKVPKKVLFSGNIVVRGFFLNSKDEDEVEQVERLLHHKLECAGYILYSKCPRPADPPADRVLKAVSEILQRLGEAKDV